MRIGHYERSILAPGGIASYIERISAAQRGRGHEVYYYECAQTLLAGPVEIRQVASFDDLIRQCVDDKLDILHVHTTVPVKGKMPLPLIRTVHTHQPYCASGGRYFRRSDRPCDRKFGVAGCAVHAFTERCCSIRPKAFTDSFNLTSQDIEAMRHMPAIAVSNFVKDQMVRSGYDRANIFLVHHPAPTRVEPAAMPEGVPHFLFAGRLERPKGAVWLIRAFAEIGIAAHLDIAGDGRQYDDLVALAHRLGAESNITFHGWQSVEGLARLIDESRAVIVPSIAPETAGLISLEAQARGRAVIASDSGGIGDYMRHGKTGELVAPNDVPGLRDAITLLASDAELASRMGKSGHAAMADYSMDAHINRLSELYDVARAASSFGMS